MKKRLVSLFLAGAVAASLLAGCGGGSNTSGGDKFVIGGIGPATGAASVYGNAVKNGAQIAVDEINANGGINGYQIEFSFQDDEHDPEKAVNAYNTLKDKGMHVLMGTVTTQPCLSVIDYTNEDGIFQITPSASAVDVVKYNNCIQVCFQDPTQGTKAAKYISENQIASKIAIIYDVSDAYSAGIHDGFIAEAEKAGLQIVSDESFTADNKSDFSVQLQKAKASGAELIFLPIYATEAATLLKQANDAGINATFFGCDGLDGILTVEGFDAALAEDVILLTPFAAEAEDPTTQAFVSAYQDKVGEIPNQFAADAYDAIYIIKGLIEKAGCTPDMAADEIGSAILEALNGFTYDGITGAAMTWENGAVNKTPTAVVVKEGKYVELD